MSAVRRLKKLDAKSPMEALMHVQESYLASFPVSRATTPWVIDKYLGNFFYIGHILHAFPNAKILHIHRDPKATAWSIFRQRFGNGPVGFAYKTGDIVGFYSMYVRMMTFWDSRFDGQIIHLSYEQLVQDPARTIAALLERLGMPWEDACLSPEKVERAVATASVGQTTQAIYTGSSDIWRNYERYTDGWLDQLPKGSWNSLSLASEK